MRKILFLSCLMLALLASCSSSEDTADVKKSVSGSDNVDPSLIDSSYTYELPVIFHVLYKDANNASQYIPYERLTQLLSYVNEVYQGNVYGESANTNLKFVLATTDENGNTLKQPGVEYVKYTGDYPISPSEFMSGNNVSYIWEPNNYINIMMYNFKQESVDQVTLGLTSMPYCVTGHEVEGLSKASASLTKKNLKFAYCSSINSLYANVDRNGEYYESDRYTNADHEPSYLASADVVVTLCHELGATILDSSTPLQRRRRRRRIATVQSRQVLSLLMIVTIPITAPTPSHIIMSHTRRISNPYTSKAILTSQRC